ncbi:MAG: flagellar biosynthesis protein FlhB [Clostridiales bacterium]|nr:flagellar biosynthesis protein FlhB [Clostridiales bacterium]
MEKKKPEKLKQAVAISYEMGEEAPRILATGKGVIAERLIAAAKDIDLPIYEDAALAKTLGKLEIGDMIPSELYEVVAEILVFVNDLEKIKNKIS